MAYPISAELHYPGSTVPYRKNVFLLGAGASFHAGAPLMGDFLEVAQEYFERGQLSAEDSRRFGDVLNYQKEHDSVEQAGFNLTNLEDLFGLLEMDGRVKPVSNNLRDDLVFVILKTLELRTDEQPTKEHLAIPGAGTNPEEGITISQHLVDIISRRWDERPFGNIARDAIISLNYDLVIERAMQGRGLAPLYCFDGLMSNQGTERSVPIGCVGVKVLKLHGSVNWSICPKCESVRVVPNASAAKSNPCSNCNGAMKPFIVPPTWSKGERRAALEGVWRTAFSELVEARRWIIIGSSLVKTDLFLRYLLALARKHNSNLDRILIIDPNLTGYDELFKQIPKRISLEHQTGREADLIFYLRTGRLWDSLGYGNRTEPHRNW